MNNFRNQKLKSFFKLEVIFHYFLQFFNGVLLFYSLRKPASQKLKEVPKKNLFVHDTSSESNVPSKNPMSPTGKKYDLTTASASSQNRTSKGPASHTECPTSSLTLQLLDCPLVPPHPPYPPSPPPYVIGGVPARYKPEPLYSHKILHLQHRPPHHPAPKLQAITVIRRPRIWVAKSRKVIIQNTLLTSSGDFPKNCLPSSKKVNQFSR